MEDRFVLNGLDFQRPTAKLRVPEEPEFDLPSKVEAEEERGWEARLESSPEMLQDMIAEAMVEIEERKSRKAVVSRAE